MASTRALLNHASFFRSVRSSKGNRVQVVTFIDATSGADTPAGANSNRYYVNAFTATIVGTTSSFRTNTNRQVSRAVESNIEYIAGGTDIAAGVNDLTAQFEALPGTVAGVAVVVTDGRSSRAEATAAADRLRAAGVEFAAVAIGGEADRTTLDAVASTGSDGEELVFETDQFEDIAGLLAAVFTRIGVTFILSPSAVCLLHDLGFTLAGCLRCSQRSCHRCGLRMVDFIHQQLPVVTTDVCAHFRKFTLLSVACIRPRFVCRS